MSDLVWTPATLAEQLGVSERTVRNLIQAGRIPHIRLTPQRVVIPKQAIADWLADEARASTLLAELEASR